MFPHPVKTSAMQTVNYTVFLLRCPETLFNKGTKMSNESDLMCHDILIMKREFFGTRTHKYIFTILNGSPAHSLQDS